MSVKIASASGDNGYCYCIIVQFNGYYYVHLLGTPRTKSAANGEPTLCPSSLGRRLCMSPHGGAKGLGSKAICTCNVALILRVFYAQFCSGQRAGLGGPLGTWGEDSTATGPRGTWVPMLLGLGRLPAPWASLRGKGAWWGRRGKNAKKNDFLKAPGAKTAAI